MIYNGKKIIKCNNGLHLIQSNVGSTHYYTLQDIYVYINGFYFKIPKGFTTDGASIPSKVQSIYYKPLDEAVLFAGVVHDYLCCTHMPAQTKFFDKELYDFKDGYLYLQLFDNKHNPIHKLKLSKSDATQVYTDFVKKYAPDQYINCGLFKINLKPKKLAAGAAFLNTFTTYHWNNKRSAYMFRNIDDVVNFMRLDGINVISHINNKYYEKCKLKNNSALKHNVKNKCIIM